MIFKVGDRVRIKSYCSGCAAGNVYPLHYGHANGCHPDDLVAWDKTVKDNNWVGCSCQDNWELFEEVKTSAKLSIKKTMKLSKLAKKLLDKDVRVLIKKGILDSDLQVTSEGMQIICEMLILERKADIVKFVSKKK